MKKLLIFVFLLCSLSAFAQPTIWGGARLLLVQGDTSFIATAAALKNYITPSVYGRSTAQTAAVASVATLTVGGDDASYEVSANVLVTTSSSENFNIKVDYTDEGNTARTINLNVTEPAGSTTANIRFTNGAIPYSTSVQHIRCKASTAITIKTTGTFTGCTYNIEGRITRI